MIKNIRFLFFLFVPWTNLFAQNDTTFHRNIDEVVVTGTRASVNRNNVPMTISVVNRNEIEESSESALLPVLSERIPGMFVTQRGVTGFGVASGGTGGITLRGAGGSPTTQVLVLIDGHPQYMGIMGHHLPDAYVASDVEKVEVIRGPASILYGSNAMGGAINIITRKQNEEGWNANGRLMYGSYNTQKYMANAGLKKGKFNGFLSLNHDRTDGHRTNSDFSITNGYAKAGYRVSDRIQVWGDVSLAGYKAQNPGTELNPMIDNIADIFRGVASATIENNYDRTNGAFKFFYNFGDHKINDGYAEGKAPKDYLFRSEDHNYGITWYQIFRPFQGNMLTVGFDFKNFGGHAWNTFTDAGPDDYLVDKTSNEIAGYLIAQQTLFNKLTVNAGLRMENSDIFGVEWVPQAGLSYRPYRHTVVKASVAKGFRSPTIRELYYKASWAGANPDLQPERMINYELSVGQAFFERRLSAELTGYIADGSNMIQMQTDADGKQKNMNTGDFKNAGVELSVKWDVVRNLRIQGNYSYLNSEKTVLYAPRRQTFLSASYRPGKWALSAGWQYIDQSHSAPTVVESYGLLNAKVSYRPLKLLEVFAKGENLTGTDYQIVDGYPMPGITIFGGINVSL